MAQLDMSLLDDTMDFDPDVAFGEPEVEEEEIEPISELDDPDTIFDEEGDGKKKEDKKEKSEGTKEQVNDIEVPDNSSSSVYSSFAKDCLEQGIFSNIPEDMKIETAEDFNKLMKMEIESRLNDTQKQINEVLGMGVDRNEIKRYNDVMSTLKGISSADIEAESADGEEVRKILIKNAAISRGLSEEQAEREVQKSLKAGTDIDDAKDALAVSIKLAQKRYDDAVNAQKTQNENAVAAAAKLREDIGKSIKESKDGIWSDISDDVKTSISDIALKPAYTEKATGRKLTELEHYSETNPLDYLKNVSLCYKLTNGFKNMENLTKIGTQKATKKAFSNLEKVLKNNPNTSGALTYANNAGDNWDVM